MLDLLDVLERAVNRFDAGALAQQQFIGYRHGFVTHVLANFWSIPTPVS